MTRFRLGGLYKPSYHVGRRRTIARGLIPGSMRASYTELARMATQGVIGRFLTRNRQRWLGTAERLRRSRRIRRQALNNMFGGNHRDVVNIIESYIPPRTLAPRPVRMLPDRTVYEQRPIRMMPDRSVYEQHVAAIRAQQNQNPHWIGTRSHQPTITPPTTTNMDELWAGVQNTQQGYVRLDQSNPFN